MKAINIYKTGEIEQFFIVLTSIRASILNFLLRRHVLNFTRHKIREITGEYLLASQNHRNIEFVYTKFLITNLVIAAIKISFLKQEDKTNCPSHLRKPERICAVLFPHKFALFFDISLREHMVTQQQ